MSYYQAVSEKAKKVILAQPGGSIEPEDGGFNVQFPTGTEIVSSSDRGAWGNLSVRIWRTPNGQSLVWDSDDRELQRGYDRP